MSTQQKRISLLILNPNSSLSVTHGLDESLTPLAPPDTILTFFTAPSHAPPSINDITTAVQTAAACFDVIKKDELIDVYDGFLVCCFSDHPLIHMLRETTSKPVVGIMESAIATALLCTPRFGIITTGSGYRTDLYTGVNAFLGTSLSSRFSGIKTTGLGVVELREGDPGKIERCMKATSVDVVREGGCGAILLGCAAMAGMEELVRAAVNEQVLGEVRVIDGAKSGLQMLAALVRLQ